MHVSGQLSGLATEDEWKGILQWNIFQIHPFLFCVWYLMFLDVHLLHIDT
jgi:hypothetical protein